MSKMMVEGLLLGALGCVVAVVCYLWFDGEPTRSEASVTGDQEYTLTHDGRQRRYLVHVPKGYDGAKNWPVVLGFHGGMGHAESQRTASRMNEVADRHGFLVVYPDGTGHGRVLYWNAGLCCGYAVQNQVDDIGFVRRLLDELATQYAVDPRRVYATGISNGAMLSYRLAHELSDRIAAIGPVGGGDMGMEGSNPPRPVPVIHFHGLKDPYAHFEGGKGPLAGVPHPPIPQVIDWWVKQNNCRTEPVAVQDEKDFIRKEYAPAPGAKGAPVVFYLLPEGGHTWPGGVDLTPFLKTGKLISSVDASTLMWQFFEQHPLRAPVGK